MSNKNPTPDRAGSYDADGLDVPTYHQDDKAADQGPAFTGAGSTAASSLPAGGADNATTQFPETSGAGVFGRTNRAAPQEIPASQQSPQPTYADQDFAAPGGSTAYQTFAYDRQQDQPTTMAPAAAPVAAPPVAPAAANYDQTTAVTESETPDHRRGTIDFGLFIVRLMLGLWLILEAVGTFFRLGGNPGLSGLQSDYAGYLAPEGLAIVIPSLQLAAGVFLVLGLITPLFAMLATIATSFTALHELSTSGAGLNVFAWPESVWLSLVLLGSSLALQFTGPGFVSLDYGRSWARRPLLSSWLFLLLAIAGGIALWWFGAGINPLA
ncbi:DoxX family protein [Corynebacterium comes]|uniref:DoxX n=1 Tax=Corynebacterium comes TaxID=2675218 RepID=A0A6B8VMS0_9CORY|nr:DoxX family protein [Corynebacterium comes]QGU04409.1 DoxX [Corynebacterium comes]